jgi:type I restriction enzyme S subunit
MEVKPGYKKIDIGVVPENWVVKKIGEIADIISGGTPSTRVSEFWNGNIYWCTPTDITGTEGKYLTKTDRCISEAGLKSSSANLLPPGTLLLCSRATIGDVKIATTKIATNQGFKSLVCKDEVDNEFLYYKVLTIKQNLVEKGIGSTFLEISKKDTASIEIAIPKSKGEQRTIAATLSDVDTLLAALDTLIAKKRLVKQGAMQELLTCKRRLPGFSGKWETINMAEHSTLKARIGWQGLTTAEYLTNGEYRLITGTDFIDGKVDWERCHFVEKNRYDQDKNIQVRIGDVLITKDGTIGKVAYIDHLPSKATLNSGVFVIRPKNNKYHPRYFYYILNSRIFDDFLRQLQAGSTINHLYQKDFVNFNFPTPEYEEQQAVAEILSDMDDEITALEQKRAKTCLLKQGMMQELLTGRIRLT